MENDVEQRTVDLQSAFNPAGVLNETEFSEPVVEENVRLHSHLLRQRLQVKSILLTLPAEDVRVGRPRDYVCDILVLGQNLRKRLNNVLDSLVRREQAEGK